VQWRPMSSVLAGALLLAGCQTTHVKYPGVQDETPPSDVRFTLATEPEFPLAKQSNLESHRLTATIRVPGSTVILVAAELIEPNLRIVANVSARDEESGIKSFRIVGPTKLCQSDPHSNAARPLEYDGLRLWAQRDYAPSGKGRLPKQINVRVTFSVAELLRATRPPAAGTTAENASFEFALELSNGSGMKVITQKLEYHVGKTACP
jgi:hypothetical protein